MKKISLRTSFDFYDKWVLMTSSSGIKHTAKIAAAYLAYLVRIKTCF